MTYARMYNAVSRVMPAIYHHSFNQQLNAGMLPAKKFRLYLEQDALYLSDFGKALHVTSKRLPNKQHAAQFKKFSEDIFQSECKLHRKYLSQTDSVRWFRSPKISVEKIPVIAHYTTHLLNAAQAASIEVAVASMVPCFWIYNELGKKMLNTNHSADHPYRDWIASYSSERHNLAVRSIIQIAEELGDATPCRINQKSMMTAFVRSIEFEMGFWDSLCAENTYAYSKCNQLIEQEMFKKGALRAL